MSSIFRIFIVILVDDGLLRINTGCTGLFLSLTMYDDFLNVIFTAAISNRRVNSNTYSFVELI